MNKHTITLKFENRIQTIYGEVLEEQNTTTILRDNNIAISQTYLLSIKHQELNSVLDLTGITPFQLLYFNEKQECTGASFSLGDQNHVFFIQTTAKHILLIPFENKINVTDFKSFEIDFKAFPNAQASKKNTVIKSETEFFLQDVIFSKFIPRKIFTYSLLLSYEFEKKLKAILKKDEEQTILERLKKLSTLNYSIKEAIKNSRYFDPNSIYYAIEQKSLSETYKVLDLIKWLCDGDTNKLEAELKTNYLKISLQTIFKLKK